MVIGNVCYLLSIKIHNVVWVLKWLISTLLVFIKAYEMYGTASEEFAKAVEEVECKFS